MRNKKIKLFIIALATLIFGASLIVFFKTVNDTEIKQKLNANANDDNQQAHGAITSTNYSSARLAINPTTGDDDTGTSVGTFNGSYDNFFSSDELTDQAQLTNWGITNGNVLYFAHYKGTKDSYNESESESQYSSNVRLVGWKFNVNAHIFLKMQDTITYNGTTYYVTGLLGTGNKSSDYYGTFSYGNTNPVYSKYQCQQLYGFSTNNIMTNIPPRAFYNCGNLQSVYLGRNIKDVLTVDNEKNSMIFGYCPKLRADEISCDPENKNLELHKCMVNNVPGTAILSIPEVSTKPKKCFGNNLCSGAINVKEIYNFGPNNYGLVPKSAFASAAAITELDLHYVNLVQALAFYNEINLKDVYLYTSKADFLDSPVTVPADNTKIIWLLNNNVDGDSADPTTEKNKSIFGFFPEGNDTWNNLAKIHLPPGTEANGVDYQNYVSHRGNMKKWSASKSTLAQDQNGWLGLQNDTQIVIDSEATGISINITGPAIFDDVIPGTSYNNWTVAVQAIDPDTVPQNYVWEIDDSSKANGYSVNEYSGEITIPENAVAGSHQEVLLTATLAYTYDYEQKISDSKTITFNIKASQAGINYSSYLTGALSSTTSNFSIATLPYNLSITPSMPDTMIDGIEYSKQFLTMQGAVIANPDSSLSNITIEKSLVSKRNFSLIVNIGVVPGDYYINLIATTTYTESSSAESKTMETNLVVKLTITGPTITVPPVDNMEAVSGSSELVKSENIKATISGDPNYKDDVIDYVIKNIICDNQDVTSSILDKLTISKEGDNVYLTADPNDIPAGTYSIAIEAKDEKWPDSLYTTINVTLIVTSDSFTIDGTNEINVSNYFGGTYEYTSQYGISNSTDATTFTISCEDTTVVPDKIYFYGNTLHIDQGINVGVYNFIIKGVYTEEQKDSDNQINLKVTVEAPSISVNGTVDTTFTIGLTGQECTYSTSLISTPYDIVSAPTYSWSVSGDSNNYFNFLPNGSQATLIYNGTDIPKQEYSLRITCQVDEYVINNIHLSGFCDTKINIGSASLLRKYVETPVGGKTDALDKVQGTNDISFKFNTTATNASGIQMTDTFAYTTTSTLPAGITVNTDGTVTVLSTADAVNCSVAIIATSEQNPGINIDFTYAINIHPSGIDIKTNSNSDFVTSVGGTMQFKHEVSFSNEEPWSLSQSVTWSIDQDSIARGMSIDQNGLLTIPAVKNAAGDLAAGTYTVSITATSNDTDKFPPGQALSNTIQQTINIVDPSFQIYSTYNNNLTWYEGQSGIINRYYLTSSLQSYLYSWSIELDGQSSQYVNIDTSGVVSISGRVAAGQHKITVIATITNNGHTFNKTQDSSLKISLPEISIRGRSDISLNKKYTFEQFKYSVLSSDGYFGDITFKIDSSIYQGVDFSGSTLTIDNSFFKTNTVVKTKIVAITANGKVVASKDITIHLNRQNNFIYILLIILSVTMFILLMLSFAFAVFHKDKKR